MRDFPGNLGRWSLIGKISSGQLRSWTRVWFMKASWSIQMNAFPWYSTTSFGNSQIDRPCKGGVLWPLWDSWVLYPSWIIWGVSWRFNGSACDEKPGSPYRPIPRGTWWTTAWPCLPLLYHLLPHLSPLPPSWWVVVMVYYLELGGLFPAPRVSSWTKIWIFLVPPHGVSFVRSSGVVNRWLSSPLWYLVRSHGTR